MVAADRFILAFHQARGFGAVVLTLAMATGGVWAQQEGSRQWRFNVDGYVTLSSPALSPDGGTVYIGAETKTAGRIVAVAREGGSRWGLTGRVLSSGVDSSPTVAPDGTIYIGGLDGKLYALNPANGASYWERLLGGFISSSPALAPDGTIYVGASDGSLYAVAQNGTQRWAFPTDGTILSSSAIATDGSIYFGSYDRNLYAVTPAGQEKWRFATGGTISSSPAIAADGTIYFGAGDQRLYALTADGVKKWDYLTNGPIHASPTLGADGTIYFAADRSFYALRPGEEDGRLRWKTDINTSSISSSAIRGDGTIIFGADDGVVRALNPGDGSLKWSYDTRSGAGNLIESSPLVAPDGSIYVGSQDGALYKINGNGSPLSSYSSWPGFRGGVRNTGHALAPHTGGQLANIATRAQAGGSSNLVAGFVVHGSTEKTYLVRAAGPGLANVGVNGSMPDPLLDVYSGRVLLQANDNWLEHDRFSGFSLPDTAAGVGAFPLEPGSKDAAIVRPLPPGSYTAHVRSADAGQGVALVEVYDARGGDVTGRIVNLSTRGQVGAGQNILIAGLVVSGTGTIRLLLRGIGPGLAQFGVPNVLTRPRMDVFRGPASVGSNVGWTSDGYKGDLAASAAAVAAFPLAETGTAADCAMLLTATAGEYTIQISGVGATTGEAMVEVYVLP